jgi:hypothetical protein
LVNIGVVGGGVRGAGLATFRFTLTSAPSSIAASAIAFVSFGVMRNLVFCSGLSGAGR